MFELRVITGFQQGAVLPLIGSNWSLGTTDEMDFCLVDPQLNGIHVNVSKNEQNELWHVVCLSGSLQDLASNTKNSDDFPLDVPFQINGVWFAICHMDTQWEVLQSQVDEYNLNLSKQPASPTDVEAQPIPHIPQINSQDLGSSVLTSKLDFVGRTNLYRNKLVAFLGLFTAVVTTSVLALDAIKTPAIPVNKFIASPSQQNFTQNHIAYAYIESVDEVMRVIQKMLRQRELGHVSAAAAEESVVLTGEVSKSSQARVKRMLIRFAQIYNTNITLVNNVIVKRHTLPFKIVQINSGELAHVITESGQKLFEGDEIDGVRLTRIEANRIEFNGGDEFSITW